MRSSPPSPGRGKPNRKRSVQRHAVSPFNHSVTCCRPSLGLSPTLKGYQLCDGQIRTSILIRGPGKKRRLLPLEKPYGICRKELWRLLF